MYRQRAGRQKHHEAATTVLDGQEDRGGVRRSCGVFRSGPNHCQVGGGRCCPRHRRDSHAGRLPPLVDDHPAIGGTAAEERRFHGTCHVHHDQCPRRHHLLCPRRCFTSRGADVPRFGRDVLRSGRSLLHRRRVRALSAHSLACRCSRAPSSPRRYSLRPVDCRGPVGVERSSCIANDDLPSPWTGRRHTGNGDDIRGSAYEPVETSPPSHTQLILLFFVNILTSCMHLLMPLSLTHSC